MPRKKIDASSPLYSFADKLKALRDEKGYTNQQLKEAIEEKLGYSFSEATLNNWLQHYVFPEYEKLVAICKVFPPYSVEYLMGVIDDKPSYDLAFIEKYSGLSCEAIEHLKELSRLYPETLNHLLEGNMLDSIAKNIDSAINEESSIKKMERHAIYSIKTYILDYASHIYDKLSLPLQPFGLNDIEKLHETIDPLSNENIDNTLPSLRIETYKRDARIKLEEILDQLPKLHSNKYHFINNVFEKYIRPIESAPDYSKEYFDNVLWPLFETFDKSTPESLNDVEDYIIRFLNGEYGQNKFNPYE